MANRISKLTKRSVDAIEATGSDSVYWCGSLTGFGLRVRASGSKTYILQARVRGKLRWFTLGRHGPMSPDQARTKALEFLALAMKGIDPRGAETETASHQPGSPSVADLGRRFMDEHVVVHCKPGTQAHYGRMVERFIAPELGGLPVDRVHRSDVATFHYGLRSTPYQANRVLGILSKMFTLAEVWGWRADGTNPCRHIKPYKEYKRERFLSEEEIARLGAVLRRAERSMPSAVAAFRLLLLTGCRLSEIQKLRWEYVKEDCIELPDSKTGGRFVPLSPDARAVLSAIPRESGSPWVIAGQAPGSHIGSLQRPWTIIRERAGLEGVRIHDLRHTFASRALALGESLPMIGKLLGHTQVQTTARYAHLARDSINSAAARVADSISSKL
ncbi:MAG: site-specific integrase [Rhodospirillaceae bacterium]|nr:site-specific integrase [Rhodospirillaceae bacterium]